MSKIKKALIRQFGKDIVVHNYKKSERILFLKEMTDDLQVGLLLEEYKKTGAYDELVDIGIRVPSVEHIVNQYEVDRMREMGFQNPEPIGWLTLWKSTYSYRELQEKSLDATVIYEEFMRFVELIAADIEGFQSEALNCLRVARKPSWATKPGSSYLVTKALALNNDGCANIDQMLQNEPDAKIYREEIDEFCQWLSDYNEKQGTH